MWYAKCPLNPARGSGERCKLPSGSGQSPAAERYLLHFALKKRLLMTAISRAYSRQHTRKFDKRFSLRSFETYVYWRTVTTDPLYVAPTREQLVTNTTRR